MTTRLVCTIVMLGAIASSACNREQPSMADTAAWRKLMSEMQLPSYKVQRLEQYVRTLDGTRKILASADGRTRDTAFAAMDHEMSRALPLLVPAQDIEPLQAYLGDAMRQQ